MSLLFGLLVQVFFNAFTQGQDAITFLIVFAGFGACIIFREFQLALPSGVAFGIGILVMSFLGQDWWLAGLAITAVIVNLAKYAWWDSNDCGLDEESEKSLAEESEKSLTDESEKMPISLASRARRLATIALVGIVVVLILLFFFLQY